MGDEETEPRVGIFWTWKGQLFHAESCPLSRGVRTTVSIDYPIGHYNAWFLMERRGLLNRLPPELRDEYDAIPRGRIIYHLNREAFIIYHGDEYGPAMQATLMEMFRLPADTVVDEVDMHYNPLPEDFLF